jgi:hypothetical protein
MSTYISLYEAEQVSLVTLTPAHYEETVALACDVFARREPLGQALGLREEEFRPYAAAACRAAMREGLGVIALQRNTRRVVGYCLAKDYQVPLELAESGRFSPVQQLFERLDAWYECDYGKPRARGAVAHELMAGVSARCPFQSVELELMVVLSRLLHHKGFAFSVLTATSPGAQELHASLGAHQLYAVGYGEFVDVKTGARPFAALAGQHCTFMLKDLLGAPATLQAATATRAQ